MTALTTPIDSSDPGPADDVCETSAPGWRTLNPLAQLKLLQWIQQQYDALAHWTDADLDLALDAMRAADADLVERTHRAYLHRLTVALSDNVMDDTPVVFCPENKLDDGSIDHTDETPPTTIYVEPDSNQVGWQLGTALAYGRPIGQGLLPGRQIVYAVAYPYESHFRFISPSIVYWIADGAVVARGDVVGHRQDCLVRNADFVVVALDVDMAPWLDPVALGKIAPRVLHPAEDFAAIGWAGGNRPDGSVMDFRDGRPLDDLPSPVTILDDGQIVKLRKHVAAVMDPQRRHARRLAPTGLQGGVAARPDKRISSP